MKHVKLGNRKKSRFRIESPRRAINSSQVLFKQGVSSGNGRRAKGLRQLSSKTQANLYVTARRLRETSDGDRLLALKQFEAAVRYFQKENYSKAGEILERLANTAPPEIADRARIHLRLCERRRSTAPVPKTAADSYLFGVAELNAGRPGTAAEYLEKAHKMEPKREDICYALAACYALQGKADAALELLKTAIGLRPQNRLQARQDPDFQSLLEDARFGELVRSRISQTPRPTT